MADSAAHLVDRVIPLVPMRQWVLTCPIPIRLAMARDPRLVSQVLRVFHQRIFAFHRRIARSMGIEGGQCGSVTFVQRAGGGVNSHVHFHGLVPDGVFYETNEGGVSFVPTLGPTDADVAGIVASIVRRVLRLMQGADENENEPDNEDGRGAWQSAFAPPSGLPKVESGWEHPKLGSLCANTDGFSLHAGRLVPATDRAGLEQLCRYGLRSSFCASRLSVSDDGQLYVYRLKRPWPDGRLEMQFEPLDLMRRLAHLVPPPRFNQVRYTGVFSPNSAFRSRIVPRIDIEKAEAHHFRRIDTSESARLCSMLPNALSLASNAEVKSDASQAAQSNAALPEPLPIPPALLGTPQPEKDLLPLRDRYLKWDQLLRRTFSIDVTRCPRCDGRMKVLAAISFPPHVQKILSHLGLPSELPPIASARAPPQSDFDLDFDCDN